MYKFPVTVAFDRDDRRVLDAISVATGLPHDEVVRRAVRMAGMLRTVLYFEGFKGEQDNVERNVW